METKYPCFKKIQPSLHVPSFHCHTSNQAQVENVQEKKIVSVRNLCRLFPCPYFQTIKYNNYLQIYIVAGILRDDVKYTGGCGWVTCNTMSFYIDDLGTGGFSTKQVLDAVPCRHRGRTVYSIDDR